MSELFLELLNLSIMAGWLVLAVLVARICLKKSPKYIRCILWGLVGLRLVFPFSIESIFSLLPSSKVIDAEIVYDRTPTINSGIPVIDDVTNNIMAESFTPNIADSVNPLQVVTYVAANIWVVGVAVMFIYCVTSYILVRRKVFDAVKSAGNVYECERVTTPFVLGVLNPRIYIPFHMDDEAKKYVVAHERAHIKRGDHLTKLAGFLVLSIYWFHPLLWVAYILLCKDIELACDEKALKSIGETEKKNYSKVLLKYSVSPKMIAACPVAFGEVAVKQRIKNVLNYKKPAFWIIVVSVIACVVVAVCFMTNPKEETDTGNGKMGEWEKLDNPKAEVVPDEATESGNTGFDESTVLIEADDIFSIKIVNGNTGEEKETSVLMSDNTMRDLMNLYNALEFQPYEKKQDAKDARVGYEYCIRLYDIDGNLLQTVTPYKDSVKIDDVRYESDVFSSQTLLTYLELLFYPTKTNNRII